MNFKDFFRDVAMEGDLRFYLADLYTVAVSYLMQTASVK